MSGVAREGQQITQHRPNGLEGNLERAKTSYKSNPIYGTDASPWAI